MSRKTTRVLISGRVQGVSFRDWTRRQAQRLSLSGFVRNLADGRVEAVFSGDEEAVTEMVARCHEGPPAAKVDAVDSSDFGGDLPDTFDIRTR